MSKSYHHGDLKKELIQSGIKMIQQEGIEKLSLRKLAYICGVSEAAPYSHFESKDQLLVAMQEYVTGQLTQCLKYEVEKTDKQNSETMISNMGKAYIRFFMEHPEYYTFLFTQPCVTIDLSMKSDSEEFLPFHYYKTKAFEIYRKQGFKEEQIKYGIIAMWAKVHGMAAIVSMKYITKDFEWEDVFDQILME